MSVMMMRLIMMIMTITIYNDADNECNNDVINDDANLREPQESLLLVENLKGDTRRCQNEKQPPCLCEDGDHDDYDYGGDGDDDGDDDDGDDDDGDCTIESPNLKPVQL